jgi:hypothetical protein
MIALMVFNIILCFLNFYLVRLAHQRVGDIENDSLRGLAVKISRLERAIDKKTRQGL